MDENKTYSFQVKPEELKKLDIGTHVLPVTCEVRPRENVWARLDWTEDLEEFYIETPQMEIYLRSDPTEDPLLIPQEVEQVAQEMERIEVSQEEHTRQDGAIGPLRDDLTPKSKTSQSGPAMARAALREHKNRMEKRKAQEAINEPTPAPMKKTFKVSFEDDKKRTHPSATGAIPKRRILIESPSATAKQPIPSK